MMKVLRKASIYSGDFLTGFGLKMRAKPRKTNKMTIVPPHLSMLEVHAICPSRICCFTYALGAFDHASGPKFFDPHRF